LFRFSEDTDHSVQIGLKALSWILGPMNSPTFFDNIFQKRALVIKRNSAKYFEDFFSTPDFFKMLDKV
jgi:hypothetical protein